MTRPPQPSPADPPTAPAGTDQPQPYPGQPQPYAGLPQPYPGQAQPYAAQPYPGPPAQPYAVPQQVTAQRAAATQYAPPAQQHGGQPQPYVAAAPQPAAQPYAAPPQYVGQPQPLGGEATVAVPAPTIDRSAMRTGAVAAPPAAVPTAAPPLAQATADGQLPPGPSVHTGHPPSEDLRRPRGLRGRMRRLRIGSHLASRSALAQLGLVAPGAGLLVGVDFRGSPVAVRLFRPEPTRVTIVGGVWPAQLLVFRALAAGAQVVVVSNYAQNWVSFAAHATGDNDRLVALAPHQSVTATATARRPVLIVDDRGQAETAYVAPLGPWQTQITVLHQLDRPGSALVQGSDLTILQRLGNGEAAVAGQALRLTRRSLQALQTMPDDVFALLTGGVEHYVKVAQTSTERSYTGNPRRA